MIKVKDLTPGRVLSTVRRRWTRDGEVLTVEAWMVIGWVDNVKRRHKRSTARRESWHVLLLKFGGGERILHDVVITPGDMMTNQWKRLF